MKYFVMMVICTAMLFSFTGCDKKKDNRDTRSCWETIDEMRTYKPKGHHIKFLKHGDVQEANYLLNLGSVKDEYEESQFRTICTVSTWTLTDYTAAPKWWPFQVKIDDTWVDQTKSITLTLTVKHCPKPQPNARWHPLSREEIEELGDSYDPNDPDDWGYWIYDEAECPCDD